MLRRIVLGSVMLLALGATALYGRQGIVMTKDGKSYEGDVNERGDSLEITGVANAPGPVSVAKLNVASVNYIDETSDKVLAALKQLKPTDVTSRMNLAQVAISAHAWDAAAAVLEEVRSIDPNNREAADLLAVVKTHIKPPAVQPATKPVAVPPPATQAVGPKVPMGAFIIKREASASEINRIKQMEAGSDEVATKLRVKIDPEVKKEFVKFMVQKGDMTQAEFNKKPLGDQAAIMLASNNEDFRKGVTILNDPATVLEYKKQVQQILLQGCAASNCHGGKKAGLFTLINPARLDPPTYTNYLEVQRFAYWTKGALHPLVDRVTPESSLLLKFMLPRETSDVPHPEAPGFKAVSKLETDPKYTIVLTWLKKLDATPPNYGIDLSLAAAGKAQGK